MEIGKTITRSLITMILGLVLCLVAMIGFPQITKKINALIFDEDQVKDTNKRSSRNTYQRIKDELWNVISNYCKDFIDLESQKNNLYEKVQKLIAKWHRKFDAKKSEIVAEVKGMDLKGVNKATKKMYGQASEFRNKLVTDATIIYQDVINKVNEIKPKDVSKWSKTISVWFYWLVAMICDFGVDALTKAKTTICPENPTAFIMRDE